MKYAKNKLTNTNTGKKKFADEDKPSPFGERINPQIDDDYKKKWEKKPTVPGEVKKGRKKKLPDIKEEDGDDIKEVSLSDRLNTPIKKGKGVAKTGPKQPSGEKKRVAAKSPKKPKRNPWSDDSESNEELSGVSDMEELGDDYIPAEKREMAPRRAAVKTKYNFDSDEYDPMKSDGSDDDAKEAPPPRAVVNHENAEAEEKLNGNISSDMSDSESNLPPPSNPKGQSHNDLFDSLLGNKSENQNSGKTTEIRKNVDSDSDSSSGFKIEVEKPAPKAAPKKRPRKASDDSSEDDFKPKAKKEAKPKKPAAPRKKAAPKEGAAAKKPRQPKAKPKKKGSDSDEEFGASGNDDGLPAEPQPAREPRSGRTKAPTKFTFDSDSDEDDF